MQRTPPLFGIVLLGVSLSFSCGAGPTGRQTTASVSRGDDTWFVGPRCAADTPTEPASRVDVLAEGSGQPVTAGMSVRVHYVASLPSGAVLRDTHDGGVPSEVILGSTKMLCGLERALIGMRPGEQRRVVVPWSLAFGENGRPPEIPPRTDLVFVIDMYLPANVVLQHGAPPVNPAAGGRRR
jgi:hypothetical protein